MSLAMSDPVYIETLASTADQPVDMVMLHGWAMHGALFKVLANQLTDRYRVHLVDLPGHGSSQLLSQNDVSAFNLTDIAHEIYAALEKKINTDAVWLGWSLGGLVATRVAELYPHVVRQLILLSSSPAFIKQHDWPCAVDAEVFEGFANELENDLPATVSRFLSLQVRGGEDSRQTLKQLRKLLFSKELASRQVLQAGLKILQQADMRDTLAELDKSVLLLGGERDTLVPQQALRHLANDNRNMRASIIRKAGHAPFLSHPEQCAQVIKEFTI
jgi:pimeloyl-[acyl-carrier protein] methyl ester esterase